MQPAPPDAPPAIEVHVFRSGAFARNGDSVVCVGPRGPIEALLGPGALGDAFFGYAEYVDEQDRRFIGVWGARNASHLRTLLRGHGARLTLRHEPPPARLRLFETRGDTRATARRAARQA